MEILIGSWSFPRICGPTSAIEDYLDYLPLEGFTVRVVSPSKEKSRLEHYPVTPSVTMKTISSLLSVEEIGGFSLLAEKEIEEIKNRFKPDIFWSQMISLNEDPFEKTMCASEGKKVVSIHSLGEEIGKDYANKFVHKTLAPLNSDKMTRAIARKIEKAVIKRVKERTLEVSKKIDLFIVPSKVVKEKVLSYGVKTPIEVIPTGVEKPKNPLKKEELKKIFNIPKDGKVILYAGRLAREKNVDILVKSLKYTDPRVYLLIIGEGDRGWLEELVREEDLEKRVIFTGGMRRKRLLNSYSGADALVFASSTEAQGLVIWEAMIAGLPVIANKLSVRDEVYPEGTVLLVSEVTPREYGKRIKEILENKEKTKEIKEKASNFVLEKTKEKTLKQLSLTLKSLL